MFVWWISPFILVYSFVAKPTDVSKALFVSELYFIKGLQRWLGLGISQVTVMLIGFGFIIFILCVLDDDVVVDPSALTAIETTDRVSMTV